ncbi:MAG: hypothetical protein HYV63_05230 [Candidatus Schekmanbacteria bacterium]|nr:hypothetical protein [Candidatus Schekmanbacteria bacterium]
MTANRRKSMSHRALAASVALALPLCALAPRSALAAQNEVIAYGVDSFSSECGGNDLDWSVAFAEAVYDIFNEWRSDGDWDQVSISKNTGVDGRDWTDASKDDGAYQVADDENDPYGADHADVAFLSSHGNRTASSSGGYLSRFVMGDDTDDCSVSTENDLLLGNGSYGDAEIAIFATCHSGDYTVWQHDGYDQVMSSSGSLNTYLGFHGVSYDSRTERNELEDFVNASYSNGLGDNWLDEMYGWYVIYEQCPVAIVWSSSDSTADSVYDYGGFADRDNFGSSKSQSTYYYLKGCNPQGADKLPS